MHESFRWTVTRDEDGVWIVECPSIPGCVSQGATKSQALKNIRDAIRLCLEVRGRAWHAFDGGNLSGGGLGLEGALRRSKEKHGFAVCSKWRKPSLLRVAVWFWCQVLSSSEIERFRIVRIRSPSNDKTVLLFRTVIRQVS